MENKMKRFNAAPHFIAVFLIFITVSPFSSFANQLLLGDCVNPGGFHDTTYFRNEGVCVTGVADYHQPSEPQETPFPEADVYVTNNRSWSEGDSLSGRDVTAGGKNLIIGEGGSAFYDEPVWLPRLIQGEYDIVLDDNKNGIYEYARDLVLGIGPESGFTVLPEDLAGFVFNVDAIKFDAAGRRNVWQGIYLGAVNFGHINTAISAATTVYYSLGGSSTMLMARLAVGGVLSQMATSYNGAVTARGMALIQSMAGSMATHYDDLANDPADPDFENQVALDVTLVETQLDADLAAIGVFDADYPFVPKGTDSFEASLVGLANRAMEQAAIVRALIQSHEKFLGARNADDLEWAVVHAGGMARYGSLLEENLIATKAMALAVKAEMEAIPGGSDIVDVRLIAETRDRVATTGLTASEISDFIEWGWTDADIANLVDVIVNRPIPADDFTGPGLMDVLSDSIDTFIPTVHDFTNDALALKDALETQIAPVNEPAADAGGPYAGDADLPVSFDGSGSLPNDGSITLYEWDLDLDGSFDDGAGPTPDITFPPFGGDVSFLAGLKVTNELGLQDIAYATLTISVINGPPKIVSFSPADVDLWVEHGDSLLFSAEAVDPESEDLTFSWDLDLDGVIDETGQTFEYAPLPSEIGIYSLRLRVEDTDPFSPDAFEQRQIAVLFPDSDRDGYRSDVDCDDSNPDVNPGEVEQPFNNIDDDCDPDTSDLGVGPTADFSAAPLEGVVGVPVQFTNLSTDPDNPITDFAWIFGDGNSSVLENPIHTFASVGTFGVTLEVADETGFSDSMIRLFVVGPGESTLR